MKGNIRMILKKDMVCINGHLVICIKVSIRKIKEKAMVKCIGMMVVAIKVNGLMECSKDLVE